MATDDNDRAKHDRRIYYDHEPAYLEIARVSGTGWDDLPRQQASHSDSDSYANLRRFLAQADAKGSALELGCGGGQASILLARHGYRAAGVDFSETAIAIARKNAAILGLECTFRRGDVTSLDFLEDESFELVVDNHCLHCLTTPEDRRSMIGEAYRVLKSGGTFFCDTMSCEGDFDPGFPGLDDEFVSEHQTRIWVSKERLTEEITGAGFRLVGVSATPQTPKFGDLLTVIAIKD